MKLDTVNNPNNKFNEYIYFSISSLNSFIVDPLIKFKPHKWGFLRKHEQVLNYLRQTGRQQILDRLEMIKKNQELPNDILTNILKSHGKNNKSSSCFFIMIRHQFSSYRRRRV